MDFGNPKELKIFLTICVLIPGSEAFGKRKRGGGGISLQTCVTRLMRPKYLLKKSDRRCALTQLANKKYDSVSFAIRITFEEV